MANYSELGPAILGQQMSDEMYSAGLIEDFEGSQADIQEALRIAENLASRHSYLDKDYFVKAARAFAIPRIIETNDEVTTWGMDSLVFKGNLTTYSMVKIGRLIGGNAVRSLCLTFDDVTLLPTFEKVEPADYLHVPVFAVSEIDRM